MPLVAGDGGAVEEEPLAGFVGEGGFVELDFDGFCEMLVHQRLEMVDFCFVPNGCLMTLIISVGLRALTSRYIRSNRYKAPATSSHLHPS
jgi:hypothetical protein